MAMPVQVSLGASFAFLLACLPVPARQQPSRQDPQALALRAQTAFSEGQYPQAEKDYNELLGLGVGTPAVYSNLGVVYLRERKFDSAIEMLQKAKSLAPEVAGIRLNLGLAYFRSRQFRKASTAFGEVLAMDAENAQARYLKGVCEFMMDDYAPAVRDFEPLAGREQGDLEFLFMLGVSYGMLHRTPDSERTFERLVEAGGDSPHLHLLLGKAYLGMGQQEKAASELEQAAVGDTLPFVHYYLGMLDRQREQLDLAGTEFRKEIAVAPSNQWAYKELAELRLLQDDVSGAVALLEEGLSRNPDSALLLSAAGGAYLRIPDAGRAIAKLRQAVRLDPQNSAYHYQLGRAYLLAGRREEGYREMQRVRSLVNEPRESKMELLSRDQNTDNVANVSH
jgi:tetratricopeptide (TPR) repeat protein